MGHEDTQFGKVQENVGAVQKQVEGFGRELDQATVAINTNIGRVGKPEPPKPAVLEFTLWKDQFTDANFPTKEEGITQNSDGSITFTFSLKNVSEVQAEETEIWVHICRTCTFVKDPDGFGKLAGMDDQTRHRVIGNINAGVMYQIISVSFKPPAIPTPGYGVAFSYTCKNCGNVQTTSDFILNVSPLISQS